MFLKDCKFVIKEKMMREYDDIEVSSDDFDKEDSDEEISNEENSDEKTFNEEN